VEYCWDYDERVEAIKEDKPKNEIKTRLRLFKILPKKAEKDLPRRVLEADRKLDEAYRKWEEANRKCDEAHRKCDEARRKWTEADRKWSPRSKARFHKKWCNCGEWNGKEIVFKK
jgi:hypothetical protein